MKTLLRDLFDTTVASLNIVASTEQLDSAFTLASNEFFSVVYPSEEVLKDHASINLLEVGFIDTLDTFGFGVGHYVIKQKFELVNTYSVRIEPLDITAFSLYHSYSADYQRVCRYYLKQVEKDNMTMLRGFGVEQVMYEDAEDIQLIRDELHKRYAAVGSYLVSV